MPLKKPWFGTGAAFINVIRQNKPIIVFTSGQFYKMNASAEKVQSDLGYGQNILIQATVYFEQKI